MLKTIMPTVVLVGLGGREAGKTQRPLRVLPKGGFGVMHKGTVRPVTITGPESVALDLTGTVRFSKDECRAARLADLGVPTKAAEKAAAKAAFLGSGSAKPRTPGQLHATVRMCEGNLAKARASGDANRIAKAEKALATALANAGLREPTDADKAAAAKDAAKGRKAAKQQVARAAAAQAATAMGAALQPTALAAALKAAGVDLAALIEALAQQGAQG